MKLDVKISNIDDVFYSFKQSEQRQIVKSAVNSAGSKTFSTARRQIKKRYNIQAKTGELPLEKRKATANTLSYSILAPTRMLNTTKFKGTKVTKKGLSYSIVRGQKKISRSTFIARPTGKDYSQRGQTKKVSLSKDIAIKRQSDSAYPTTSGPGMNYSGMLLSKHVQGPMRSTFAEIFQEKYIEGMAKKTIKKAKLI